MGGTRHYLVVGIDFGTTYTGVSYGWSELADDSDIMTIERWPTMEVTKEQASKVPTQIAYGPSSDRKYWGYQIKSGVIRCAWMKLLLDKNARQSPHDDPRLKEDINKAVLALPDGKDAQRVTTDFFKELYNHTMDELQRHYPSYIINLTPINYWFTMPAIWSDEAQLRTLRAAEEAGFGAKREKDQVFVITEPEAAALATATTTSPVFGDQLEVDERILVCDCGGGTVDLTSYIVKNDDPWELAECSPGEGGKCGGTYLDRKFHQLLTDRFKDAFSSLGHDQIGQGSKLMEKFDYIKQVFGNGLETFKLPLAMALSPSQINPQYYDEIERLVILTKADVEFIFNPVVDKITKLISSQVEKSTDSEGNSVHYLLLVGGLGKSPYLRNKLKQWCLKNGIRIGSPMDSWGIVSRGAVVRGLELATVTTRKCRRHYGIVSSREFRQGVDNEAEKYYCPFTRRTLSGGYMSWSILRGEDIVGDTPKSISFYQVISEGQQEVVIQLKMCNEDQAPEKYDSKIVEDMKNIVTSLGDLDMSRFEKMTVGGKTQYKFDFALEVILGHKQGTIAFRIRADNKVVGQTSLDLS